jgi:hypothetical protein
MNVVGSLTKASSHVAILVTISLALAAFASKAIPARAADLGGDCCGDLEERVAELEATTIRKGNKKVVIILSGWVIKSLNWWDDGKIDHAVVGDKDYDNGTRFAITGSATISPGWSAGFNVTVNTWATTFGIFSSQLDDLGPPIGSSNIADVLLGGGNNYGAIATLYSYVFVKSDKWGTLNWGHLSPASDNPAVLADLSGTVLESNAVLFEGPSFFLRPKGQGNSVGTSVLGTATLPGLVGVAWGDLLRCQGIGGGIGADCWPAAQPAVRYDSPTWHGLRFETSYGKNELTGPLLTSGPIVTGTDGRLAFVDASDTDFWDISVFYTATWNSLALSAAYAFTWTETAIGPAFAGLTRLGAVPVQDPQNPTIAGTLDDDELHQIGFSVLHTTSGFGIHALYQHEQSGGANTVFMAPDEFRVIKNPDTDVWYIKPFWRKSWMSLGATVLYGEFGQYNDQFIAGDLDFCALGFGIGTTTGSFCLTPSPGSIATDTRFALVTESQIERWGAGIVQEIDSAAMHVWARWQHNEVSSISLLGFDSNPGSKCFEGCKFKQDFDDWDLFQLGGIIFF